jgi:hypothetical protein
MMECLITNCRISSRMKQPIKCEHLLTYRLHRQPYSLEGYVCDGLASHEWVEGPSGSEDRYTILPCGRSNTANVWETLERTWAICLQAQAAP